MAADPAGSSLALPATPASPAAAARGRRLPLIPLGIVTAFVVVAILAPLLSPASPYEQSLRLASRRRSGTSAAAGRIRSAPTGSGATCWPASCTAPGCRWPPAW